MIKTIAGQASCMGCECQCAVNQHTLLQSRSWCWHPQVWKHCVIVWSWSLDSWYGVPSQMNCDWVMLHFITKSNKNAKRRLSEKYIIELRQSEQRRNFQNWEIIKVRQLFYETYICVLCKVTREVTWQIFHLCERKWVLLPTRILNYSLSGR